MKALPKGIAIDGAHRFGAARVAGTGIPTADIKSRLCGGDSILTLMEDFDLTVEQLGDALRFEFERHLHKERLKVAAIECEQLWAEYDEQQPARGITPRMMRRTAA